MSITIEDENDNSPKFDKDQYTESIPENSPQGQFVLQTRVTDLDLVLFLKKKKKIHCLIEKQKKIIETRTY